MEWTLVEGSRSCHGSRWKFLHLLPRKLPFASIRFHLFPWKYIYFHLLPWKHNVCLLPWRLPATSICFHRIPCTLPPTFMEVDQHPASLQVVPRTSVYRKKRKTTWKPMEVDRTRSGCWWKSRENWMEDCVEATQNRCKPV